MLSKTHILMLRKDFAVLYSVLKESVHLFPLGRMIVEDFFIDALYQVGKVSSCY